MTRRRLSPCGAARLRPDSGLRRRPAPSLGRLRSGSGLRQSQPAPGLGRSKPGSGLRRSQPAPGLGRLRSGPGLRRLAVAVVLVAGMSGCGREAALRCEDTVRYSGATEAAPLQIPDDLDSPSEVEALRVPAAGRAGVAGGPQPPGGLREAADSGDSGAAGCNESPPDFFEEGLPG